MSTSISMPRLGESVTEGTVTRWLKSVGDRVEADEPLLEVSTDKVDTEIPSPIGGVLLEIRVAEDETVEVGTEIAVIGEAGEAGTVPASPPAEPAPVAAAAPVAPPPPAPVAPPVAPPPPPPVAPPPVRAAAPAPQPPAPQPVAPQPVAPQPVAPQPVGGAEMYATPLVRRLADEHGVDLTAIAGTGVGGRIRKQDVLDAARRAPAGAPPTGRTTASAPSAPPTGAAPTAGTAGLRGRTEKMTRLRRVVAERMAESLRVSAQLTAVVEVDVTRVAQLRQRARADFEAREGVKLTFMPFFALATVEALKEHPVLNCSIDMDAGTITYPEGENLGVAVDTARGLLVPVVRDAGELNLGGLARRIADIAARTRANAITPDELAGATFTLTNTGSRGSLLDTPIINQPNVGILATGAVVKRPAVIEDPVLGDVIAIRSLSLFALTYDHRVVDGADAARFLASVKARLEAGAFEADLGLD